MKAEPFQEPSKGKFNPEMQHSQQNHMCEGQLLRPLDQDLCLIKPQACPVMTEKRIMGLGGGEMAVRGW